MTNKIDILIQNLEKDLAALKAEVAKQNETQIKANQRVESFAETQARLSKTSRFLDLSDEN
jgi:hypothetical protein